MIYKEIHWQAVSYMTPMIEIVIMGYCFYRFAKPFMEQKKGAVCTGAAYSLMMPFLYLIPFRLNNFTA